MPEKYLVIGASSFYGSSFVQLVRAKGDQAIEVSLRTWTQSELSEPEPDYIVNFAAANIVAESWEKPAEYCDVNVVQLTKLLEATRKQKLKKYVHVSTPEVYGTTEGWVDETSRFNPTTPYAVSRAAGDMMVTAYHKAYGLPAVITRTANIYGPGQPNHRIIPLAFEKIRKGEKIQLHGGGRSQRCFIHVKDACEATYRLARLGSPGQTYHISTNHEISIANLIKRICTITGARFDQVTETVPDRLGKDFAYFLRSDRIRNMGWCDKITLDRGLQECASAISA